MEELTALLDAADKIGIFVLCIIVGLFLGIKILPDFVKKWQDNKIATQKSFDDRNKVFNEQFQVIIKVAEQGNQMIGQATQIIAQSNEIIRMNTEAIKNNTTVHDKVITALGNDLAALQALSCDIKTHDHRAEKIHTGVEKLLDRTD